MRPVTYLTTSEAAEILRTTSRSLTRWHQENRTDKPRPAAIAGHYLLFSEKEIRAWMARQQA